MGITFQSEYSELKSVLLKHPRDAFREETDIDDNWLDLHYTSKPDLNKALEEYDRFVDIFRRYGIKTFFLEENSATGLDSIYVRDASITTDQGMLICNMGKAQRQKEPDRQLQYYLKSGQSILGSFQGKATIEGGDVAWLDNETLAVARGYRTNNEGIAQLKSLLKDTAKVVVMEAPHYKGPTDVFHLMSVLSPVDKNLAVVYSPLMTVPFRELLIARGINFVEVPDEEFDTLGCNVLAIAPGVCMMVKGNPITKSRLERAGVEVIEFAGDEICLKGNGGPTCLTRPLQRLG